MVPENHRVRLATCEFTGYAILWWNELDNSGLEPDTWECLKRAMRGRFLPTTYKRDLKKKLQHLNQGNNSINDYYIKKCRSPCSVVMYRNVMGIK